MLELYFLGVTWLGVRSVMKFNTTWLELWLVVKLKFTSPSGYWLLLSWVTRDDSGTVELELMVVPVGVVRLTGFREKVERGLVGVVSCEGD